MASWFTSLATQARQLADGLVAQAESAERELSKEHEVIRREKEKINISNQLSSSRLPWESDNETKAILSQDLMEKILALSMAEENFTVKPPSPILESITFSFQSYIPVILRILQLDSNLARVHAKLSPKMDEEIFWRNYYIRVIFLRAQIGIDGEESQNSIGSIPEDGFIFHYTTPSPTSAASITATMPNTPITDRGTPSRNTPQQLQHQHQHQHGNTNPSPLVASVSTPPTPRYMEESYEESYDLDSSDLVTRDLMDSLLLENNNKVRGHNMMRNNINNNDGNGNGSVGSGGGNNIKGVNNNDNNTNTSTSTNCGGEEGNDNGNGNGDGDDMRAAVLQERQRRDLRKKQDEELAAAVEAELGDIDVINNTNKKNSTATASTQEDEDDEDWCLDDDGDIGDINDLDDLIDDELEAQIAKELEDEL